MTAAVPHLKIRGLKTYFYSRLKQAFIRSVDGVDLEVNKGETLGIVGESGSGKSISMLSMMGLVSAEPGVIAGDITLQTENGEVKLLDRLADHVDLDERDARVMAVDKDVHGWMKTVDTTMQGIRGKEISMIFQNPKAALNPFETIGKQIMEAVMLHTPIKDPEQAKEKAIYWLERVKIDSPHLRFNTYPFGLSGGMCQRAMIAQALASESQLLIADEPTTGLDATIQSKIIDLIAELKDELGITIVIISHDISVISRLSDKVAVMYGGRVMEYGPAKDILSRKVLTKHPYTMALLSSIPDSENIKENGRLKAIEGEVLDTINTPKGCRFYERCQQVNDKVRDKCASRDPGLLEVSDIHRVRCWLYEK